VITELVTNAVEHATSPSVVEVERHGDAFRVAVRDYDTGHTGHDVPEATTWHAPPTSSPRGRGLAMVAAVSHTWGVLRHPDGKTVWAEMAT
jgi:anti-sigma regulatory factor (Ser/Thr protein kinase)